VGIVIAVCFTCRTPKTETAGRDSGKRADMPTATFANPMYFDASGPAGFKAAYEGDGVADAAYVDVCAQLQDQNNFYDDASGNSSDHEDATHADGEANNEFGVDNGDLDC